MENNQPDFNLNGTDLVQMMWRKRFVIAAIGIVAFVASLIVSFQITPLFQSTAILIPAAATQASKDVFVNSRVKGITVFGDDEEVEHLLQVVSSETLRRETIAKQNLFSHYEIDPSENEAWFQINKKFSNNISFRRSRYRTVRIEVLDKSPEKAAEIANTIVVLADSLMRATKRDVAKKALQVLDLQYQQTLKEIYITEDSLTEVMKKGLLNLPYQAKEVTKVYSEAIAKGNTEAAKRVEKYIDHLALNGAALNRLQNEAQNLTAQLKSLKDNLQVLNAEANGVIPSQFVIDRAVPSDKKAKPKKAIIIIVSTLSAIFFSVFLFVFVEFVRTSIYPPAGVKE
jgi:uncharacterized protein involved in exopolysaccharide biosynthesis